MTKSCCCRSSSLSCARGFLPCARSSISCARGFALLSLSSLEPSQSSRLTFLPLLFRCCRRHQIGSRSQSHHPAAKKDYRDGPMACRLAYGAGQVSQVGSEFGLLLVWISGEGLFTCLFGSEVVLPPCAFVDISCGNVFLQRVQRESRPASLEASCYACGRPDHGDYEALLLKGKPYDRRIHKDVGPPGQKSILVCGSCGAVAARYHALCHFSHHVYQECRDKVGRD